MRENWTYKKIGDLCNIKTGKLDANAANKNGKYPFFTCSKEPMSINTYAYDCECVLIAGNGDLNVKYYNGKFNAYQRTYILNLKEEIDDITIPYIYDFFLLYVDELRRKSIGGIIKYIKLGDLANAKIPVPPLSEQHAIVSELDKINELISLKKAQLSDLDALAQSIFYDMFGDPIENEKGWEVKKLEEMCSCITKGTTPTTLGFSFTEKGINFVKVESFIDGHIDHSKLAHITYECNMALLRSQLRDEDLLICIAGATIGKMAVVDTSILPANTNQACAIVRLKDKNNLRFLHAFIALKLKEYVIQMGKGVAQPNLSLGQLRKLIIFCPPLSLQQDFAKRVELIEQQKAQISSTIKDLETLLASRMQYWFD